MRRWRGLKALVHDAVDATTDLVGEGHASAHRGVGRVTDRFGAVAGPARSISGAVRLGTAGTLTAVKAVNRVVEVLTDLGLDAGASVDPAPDVPPIALRSDAIGSAAWVGDAALGAVNGVIGHHLAATGNGLDLGLVLRHRDHYLGPLDDVDLGDAIVVLVHGLGTTEWCWSLGAEAYYGDPEATFGSLLERDLGTTPVFVRYNSGRRVAESGRDLAAALERLVDGSRITRVILVGHSMGGLVARAACQTASLAGHHWLDKVDLVVSLGTPHKGAPFARFGQSVTTGLSAVDLPATRILSQILAGRSAGIRDLEHGDLTDLACDPDATAAPGDRVVPLLDGIAYAFLSATITSDPEHPVSQWLGDLLVTVGSASGPLQHRSFPIHNDTFGGVLHHQLQCHPAVYAQVRQLVGAGRQDSVPIG